MNVYFFVQVYVIMLFMVFYHYFTTTGTISTTSKTLLQPTSQLIVGGSSRPVSCGTVIHILMQKNVYPASNLKSEKQTKKNPKKMTLRTVSIVSKYKFNEKWLDDDKSRGCLKPSCDSYEVRCEYIKHCWDNFGHWVIKHWICT